MTKNIIDELFSKGAHFGYSKTRRQPSAKKFIFGTKEGLDIIDLEQTVDAIEVAKTKLQDITSKGGKIIFVGNKFEIKDLTPELAKSGSIFYVNNRWIGGTLTNFREIQKRIKKLALLVKDAETGEFAKFTKKEALKKEKEIIKLKKYYQGLLNMFEKPKAIVVIDAAAESIAVEEAKKIGIPVISISNTDNDVSEIEFPIMANDRSRSTIKFIIEELFSVIK